MTARAAEVTVDGLTAGDWPAVSAVWAEGIATGDATLETEVPSLEEWSEAAGPHRELAVVARVGGEVVAWAALSPASRRRAYAGVAEVSVYVGQGHRGQGVGRAILDELVRRAEAAGLWTLQAGVFPENLASIRLHLACGFRVVGVRERLGRLGEDWRDVVLLERRSKEVGR